MDGGGIDRFTLSEESEGSDPIVLVGMSVGGAYF